MKPTSLTGIKPTNVPHLGNYLGAIKPALSLAEDYSTLYFVADYHALTTVRDPKQMQENIYDITAAWLSCGLDPSKTILFRQSAVPEVFELSWVLSCLLATGQLERGHSYKDALANGESPNAGIFNYPVLMAADILLYDTDVVPVGKDQQQHLELARDVANRFNHVFGETLIVPEPLIGKAAVVPGVDGEKMSKSKGNGIPILATQKELKKAVMGIVTSSESLEDKKQPEGSTVFEIYRLIATDEEVDTLASKLKAGGYGWGHAKQDLLTKLESEFEEPREKFRTLRANTDVLDGILVEGAVRAAAIARKTMARVRTAVGISKGRERREKKTVRLKRPES